MGSTTGINGIEEAAGNIPDPENQVDAVVYARALERLYETNQIPAVMPRRATKIHPDLYDRMLNAGVTPNYAKPKPAKGQCWTSYLMMGGLVILPFAIGFIRAFVAHFTTANLHVN